MRFERKWHRSLWHVTVAAMMWLFWFMTAVGHTLTSASGLQQLEESDSQHQRDF